MRINSFVIAVIFLFLFNGNAICQKSELGNNQSKFNAGIELGPNLSSVIHGYWNGETYMFKLGYSGGVFFQYQITPNLSLITSIAYTRRIYADAFSLTTITNVAENNKLYKIHHLINLPILIRFNFLHDRLFLDAGNGFDFFINRRSEFFTDNKVVYDSTYKTNFMDMNLAIGIGTNIPIGKRYSMTFEVRENYYFFGNDVKNIWSVKGHSNSIQFLYGITYHFLNKKSK